MNKLYILIGISGSGKSTWAKQKCEDNCYNTVIVNRDKIRELLFGYTEDTIYQYYLNNITDLENKVTLVENILIKTFLHEGNNVIVDATHLKKEYLERYKSIPIEKEIVYFNIDVEEAIERDNKRKRKVGESIIRKQFENYKKLDKTFQYDKI